MSNDVGANASPFGRLSLRSRSTFNATTSIPINRIMLYLQFTRHDTLSDILISSAKSSPGYNSQRRTISFDIRLPQMATHQRTPSISPNTFVYWSLLQQTRENVYGRMGTISSDEGALPYTQPPSNRRSRTVWCKRNDLYGCHQRFDCLHGSLKYDSSYGFDNLDLVSSLHHQKSPTPWGVNIWRQHLQSISLARH